MFNKLASNAMDPDNYALFRFYQDKDVMKSLLSQVCKDKKKVEKIAMAASTGNTKCLHDYLAT